MQTAIDQKAYKQGMKLSKSVRNGDTKYYNPFKRGTVAYFSFEKGFNDFN